MKKTLTCLLFSMAVPMVSAQWTKATPKGGIERKSDNSVYYKLDINHIRLQLKAAKKASDGGTITINIPNGEGKIERFAVNSFPVMDEALAAQYQLGSYVGVGIDNPTKQIRFSVAPNDFQSMITGEGKYEFIEAATADKEYYSIKGKQGKEGAAFLCSTQESLESVKDFKKLISEGEANKSNDKTFHTLRLALSTTGEYTNYFGGVTGALTQMNATMTRVNGVFEKEFNLHLNMVNAPGLIFTDAATDPYSTSDKMCNWNLELMNTLNGGQYGVTNADFDIGHLFGASGGGGNAGCIGCIGSNDTSTYEVPASQSSCDFAYTTPSNYKGSAFTSPSNNIPKGDKFDIDFVAHEFGHQLGANHTFSRNEGRGVNVEPGSGSTIMAYAGVVDGGNNTNVQNNSDAYFHTVSINQVQNNLKNKAVSTVTSIANNPPVITPMNNVNYTIPKSTPFVLTAIASDPEGDALTYTWEQVDSSVTNSYSTRINIGTSATNGASFRSLMPTSDPTRYFPKLATVLSGAVRNNNQWEATYSVGRTTNFRVTVRDNKGADSQTAFATQRVIVNSTGDSFTVKTAAGNPEVPVNVTWVVAGTNAAPFNSPNVKIDFTADNGATWTTLAETTPNNGAASVTFPASTANKTVIVRVSSIGNIFYAVNKVTIGEKLAVSDITKPKVQVYPNPATDILNVTNVSAKTSYKIYNVTGQLVSTGNINNGEVKVSQLAKGVYIISFEDNATVSNVKFEKK
ncbi:reprolysin-like metallopeptidase [Chryseobacterium sp. T1]